MKKYVAFSVVAATLLMAGGDIQPVEPVVAASSVDFGKVSGQFRTFYLDRSYEKNGDVYNNRNALSAGGWLKYETPAFSGLSAAVALYGVNGFEIHDGSIEADDTLYPSYDPSLTGRGGESYAFIGEAYLNYKRGSSNFTLGRQKLDTPMAGGDDARMLPNLFEAVVYSNTGIENTTLIAAHVTKMTMGTFSNIYDNGTALGFASGYGAGTTLAQSGDFEDMGVVALGAGTDTDGVTAGAMIYNGIDGVTLQAWDYYAHDILNAVYLQADFKWNCRISDTIKPFASLQYINEQDVGSFNGKVDSNYWGAKFGASIGNLTAYVAYSKTGDSNATYDGGIISPWGGMPAFTQGMVTRHQFFSGTEAWKVAATYKLTPELSATGYYTSFDVPANNAYGLAQTTPFSAAWTAKESGFDVIYQATNDLQVRFRGNFPDKFTPTVGWNEYRFIVNYNF